jgi:hypothetical protein
MTDLPPGCQPQDCCGDPAAHLTDPESARALLHRHGLPEDVIDGALCLHAQELATLQREFADQEDGHLATTSASVYVHGIRDAADRIDPTKAAAAPAGPAPTTDRDTLRDRIATAISGLNDGGGTLADLDEEDDVLALTNAVLAVLPAPDQQAAKLVARTVRACAEHLRDRYADTWTADAARSLDLNAARIERGEPTALLRRLAGEAQQDPTQDGRTTLPCNWARTRYLHAPHDWEPQPGMEPVHCPGSSERSGQPDTDEETRCVCGDPIQLQDPADPTSWIHSPGSDTPCLNARPSR